MISHMFLMGRRIETDLQDPMLDRLWATMTSGVSGEAYLKLVRMSDQLVLTQRRYIHAVAESTRYGT